MTFFACPRSTVAQRSESCAKLIISVSFIPNQTRLCLKLFSKPNLFNKISNFKKPAERQRVRSKRGSQFYAAQVKHMHSLTPTNGTKFKIGTNSTTERGDTICFRHLTRWRLERAFLLTLVRTENGLRSGRPNPSSWHHGLSFVSSIVSKVCGES